MMKRLTFCFVLMIAVLTVAVAQDNTYEVRYNAAQTNTARLDILRGMSSASGAGDFYAQTLKQLLSDYRRTPIAATTERDAIEQQVSILAERLGAEKYTQAADDLWKVDLTFENSRPQVKVSALIALGKIGATQYLPQVIRVLERLNDAPPANRTDTDYARRLASGAIASLEAYGDPSGYLPVFFASIGWYPDAIRNQAVKSLAVISPDPYPFMMPIITGSAYDYPTRYKALQNIDASQIENSRKAEVAVAAFTEGWRNVSNKKIGIGDLALIRKLSITMIGKYKSDDVAIYPMLERSYASGYDDQEKLEAISALGLLGTEEAAQSLANFLNELNNLRRINKIKQNNEKMIRAIIPAISQAGRASAIPSLAGVSDSGWAPAVIALASDAMQKLSN